MCKKLAVPARSERERGRRAENTGEWIADAYAHKRRVKSFCL